MTIPVWGALTSTLTHPKLHSPLSISASISTYTLGCLMTGNSLPPAKICLACPALAYMGLNSISLGFPSVSPQAVPGLGRFLFHMTAQQKSEVAHTVPSRQIPRGLSTALHAVMLGLLSQCFRKIHESFSCSLIKFDMLPVAPALRPLSPFLPVLFFGFL